MMQRGYAFLTLAALLGAPAASSTSSGIGSPALRAGAVPTTKIDYTSMSNDTSSSLPPESYPYPNCLGDGFNVAKCTCGMWSLDLELGDYSPEDSTRFSLDTVVCDMFSVCNVDIRNNSDYSPDGRTPLSISCNRNWFNVCSAVVHGDIAFPTGRLNFPFSFFASMVARTVAWCYLGLFPVIVSFFLTIVMWIVLCMVGDLCLPTSGERSFAIIMFWLYMIWAPGIICFGAGIIPWIVLWYLSSALLKCMYDTCTTTNIDDSRDGDRNGVNNNDGLLNRNNNSNSGNNNDEGSIDDAPFSSEPRNLQDGISDLAAPLLRAEEATAVETEAPGHNFTLLSSDFPMSSSSNNNLTSQLQNI